MIYITKLYVHNVNDMYIQTQPILKIIRVSCCHIDGIYKLIYMYIPLRAFQASHLARASNCTAQG